jgi:uncharacterized membrane protein
MRVTERQQIISLVAITLFVGVLAVAGATALPGLLRGDLDVQHYDAVFFENGTLVERYTYDVHAAGEYRMLFRYWDAPLTFHGEEPKPMQRDSPQALLYGGCTA